MKYREHIELSREFIEEAITNHFFNTYVVPDNTHVDFVINIHNVEVLITYARGETNSD